MLKTILACFLLGVASAGVLAGSTGASTTATAVSIELKTRGSTQGTSHGGTFKLVGATLVTGTVSTTIDGYRSGKRNGQPYELIKATDTLTTKGGTLVLRSRDSIGVSAGFEHSVITGTWFVVSGTGEYAGARGSGRAATVVLPPRGSSITSLSRYQGVLTTR